MDTKTAISDLFRMKNTFRAFEHLEEILKLADQTERLLGDFEGKKIKLSEEVVQMEGQLKIAKENLEKFEKSAHEKKQSLNKAINDEKERLKQHVKDSRIKAEAEINSMKIELEETKQKRKQFMEGMVAEESRVSKSLHSLKTEYEKFRGKFD